MRYCQARDRPPIHLLVLINFPLHIPNLHLQVLQVNLVSYSSVRVPDSPGIYHILRILGIGSPIVRSQQMLIDIQVQFLYLFKAYLEVVDCYAVEVILVVQIVYAIAEALILFIDVIDFRRCRIHDLER